MWDAKDLSEDLMLEEAGTSAAGGAAVAGVATADTLSSLARDLESRGGEGEVEDVQVRRNSCHN